MIWQEFCILQTLCAQPSPTLNTAYQKGGVTIPNGKLEFNLNLFFKHHFHNNRK